MLQENQNSSVTPKTVRHDGSPPNAVQTQEQFIEWALKEYERPLVAFAQGYVRDWERARDIVQDTFVRLCQQDIEKVRFGARAWLYKVCRNRALDVIRKDSRLVEMDEKKLMSLPSNQLAPSELMDAEETYVHLRRCLDRLTPNQREVIVLKFQQDLDYEEISKITGLKSGNVGFLIHHGVKRLREMMKSEQD
jgi:RNA polymerase sigma factor (sigma-70 family)